MSCHHPQTDVLGRRLKKGDWVTVVGEPDLGGMSEWARAGSRAAFAELRKEPRQVQGFDAPQNDQLRLPNARMTRAR